MSAGYTVEVDREQLAEAISRFEFIGGNTSNALRIAINATLPKTRTLASSKIREQVRLKAGYVNDKLVIRRATKAKLSGAINTPKRGLLLSRFSTDAQVASDGIRWLKPPAMPAQGIRVKVKPTGSAKTVSPVAGNKPFYLVLKNSRALGIAVRVGTSRKVEVLHGPSLSQVFNDVRVDVTPWASDELTKEMLDAMRYILVKKYPPEPSNG